MWGCRGSKLASILACITTCTAFHCLCLFCFIHTRVSNMLRLRVEMSQLRGILREVGESLM